MSTPASATTLLARMEELGAPELRRLLVEHPARRKLGLYWESDAIARDDALNADVVLPRHVPDWSHRPGDMSPEAAHRNCKSRHTANAIMKEAGINHRF